ncbi:MAG: glycosyltransferase family 61 protein [Pseudomonadota bacterium]
MDDLQDPMVAPNPAGGWSTRILSLKDAVVVPTGETGMIQPSGVFDADGRYVHQAVLWRDRPLMVPTDLPDGAEHLAGRWIWGGVLLNHFGHFLTESTGRLWAVDAVKGAVDGLVFMSKREGDEDGVVKAFHRIFFDLLGVTLPIRIIARPTRIDLLEVPGQGFGIGPLAQGTDPFRRFVQSRFARDLPAAGGERLYISRSELGALRGGILMETRLEACLAACGYEIFHPQKHPMPEQIARYKAAEQVVALDGSALHLFAMVARDTQKVAIIKRRDSGATDGIVRHLSSFSGRPPRVIDTILQDWVRSDRNRADRFSFGELDFEALGKALAEAGLVPPDTRWTSLTAAESAAAMHEIEGRLRRQNLTFHPVPRKGGSLPEIVSAAAPPRNLRREARRASWKAGKAARRG